MPLDASTAHTVNRLVVDTDTAFYDVRHSYESLVPTIDFAELTALVKAGALSEVKQYTAEHAPHTFVNFWAFDPTPQMQLFGHRTRVVTYMMGNNIIRRKNVSPRSTSARVKGELPWRHLRVF